MYRFRFTRIILMALFTPLKGLEEEHSLTFRAVPLLDTDWQRLFTHTYAAVMGLARWHLMFSSPFRRAALSKGWFPVTSAEAIQYLKPLKAFQKFSVKSKIIFWDDDRFYLEHRFVRGEVTYAYCLIEGLMRSIQGSIRPADAFSTLGVSPAPPKISEEAESKIQALRLLRKN